MPTYLHYYNLPQTPVTNAIKSIFPRLGSDAPTDIFHTLLTDSRETIHFINQGFSLDAHDYEPTYVHDCNLPQTFIRNAIKSIFLGLGSGAPTHIFHTFLADSIETV